MNRHTATPRPPAQGCLVIGVTGGSGSGKSTLSRALERRGYLFLDCDAIYHDLLKTDRAMVAAIENRFPGTVTAGQLDRKKLGAMVFSDQEALLDLNAITHAAVKAQVLRQLGSCTTGAVIDAIGLFEGGLAELCDITVAVTAPEELRIRRLMARDGISEDYARSRIAAQHSDDWFRDRCDYTLVNDGGLDAVAAKYVDFFRKIGIIDSNRRAGE